MITIDEDILEIAEQASLQITADEKVLYIKHKFRLADKSTLGVFFFMLGGIFLMVAPFIKTSDTTSKIIGIVLGLFLLFLSILTFIQQVSDGIKITDGILTFQNNLEKTKILINRDLKVKMKIEKIQISRVGTLNSDFIIVTHFLQDRNKETPILKFQMDDADADDAKKLGNELTRLINSKIGLYN